MRESVCEVCRCGCRLGDYEDTRQKDEKLVMDDAGLANSKGMICVEESLLFCLHRLQ